MPYPYRRDCARSPTLRNAPNGRRAYALVRLAHLASERSPQYLCSFVFGNHPLKLHQKLVFRGRGLWSLDEQGPYVVSSELLEQKDLICVFATQSIRRIHKHRINLPFGRQVAYFLQTRSNERCTAVTLILDYPFVWNSEAVLLSKFSECCRLTRYGVLVFLFV